MVTVTVFFVCNRISRLAQPRKYSATPHTLNKNRSSSTENIASYNRQVNKRARSATPHIANETPARPAFARSLSVLFTPASSSKTAKKPASEQVARILGVIRQHFGPTFLSSGLQSMTAKQFVEIIRFFAQSICGDKVVIHDNNVDDVKRFVDFMEYPHQMNKSWFKAPTVSIAYDRNVEFLDWLCDFVSIDGDSIADAVENNVLESSDLEDPQFTARFFGDIRNGYLIWSDQNEQFDQWKSNWIQQRITSKMNIENIDACIERLEDETKTLQTKDSFFANEHLLQTQQNKSDELSEEVAKMRAVVEEKNIDFQETYDELNQLISKHQELTVKVAELKSIIEHQEVSAEDRRKIIAAYDHKKHLRSELQEYMKLLKETSNDNQLKIARLRMQKTSKIFACNALLQKVFHIGITFGDITIDQLSILETDTKDQIKAKLELFTQIKEFVNQRRTHILASLNETQTEVTSISKELFAIEDEVNGHKKHLHSMEIHVQTIDNQIADARYDSEQHQHQLQIKIDELLQRYEQIDSKIKNTEKLAESLKGENKKIFQGIELKADALLERKRERQARQEAALTELERLTDQLNDCVKNLK